MIPFIYVEKAVRDHPRVAAILARHKRASVIDCERYGEVFNPKSQHFRLQKQRPALILARKHRHFVQPAPAAYGVGGDSNYYFSHMLNCLYDCRYCFLQGMYRSANHVLFVNYEDFLADMASLLEPGRQTWFFSGYDGDSLALGARQPGPAEHQRHVQVEVVTHRLRVEAVDLQDIRDLAAPPGEFGVHLRELAVSLVDFDFLNPRHAWTLPRISGGE